MMLRLLMLMLPLPPLLLLLTSWHRGGLSHVANMTMRTGRSLGRRYWHFLVRTNRTIPQFYGHRGVFRESRYK
jgi:hypothetical protein